MTVRPTSAPDFTRRADAKLFRPAGPTARWAMLGACVLPVLPAAAQLGVGDLFEDDLDSATPDLTTGFHDERFAPNANSAGSDTLLDLGLDYSNYPFLQPAPGSVTTLGVRGSVNRVDDVAGETPERAAVNFSPNLSLNGVTQDWVMTVNATPIGVSQTVSFLAGMYSNPSRVNWQGGTDTDGLFWSLTTDGRANNDLLSFQGTPGAPPTAFQVQKIDGTPANVDFAENPSLSLSDYRWVTLAVGSHNNTPFFAIRTHEDDGFPNTWQVLESFDNAGGPTTGQAWFGVEDPFNSAGATQQVVFDNASISTLQPGDTDLDGDVDFGDAMRLVNNYSGDGVAADTGAAVTPGFDADLWLWTVGDFDQDRDVDFTDALALIANYDGLSGDSVRPPGNPPAGAPATLIVDVVTGDLTIDADGPLSGVAIEGENLSGSDERLALNLAATDASYVALSLNDAFTGEGFGLETGGVNDPSAWSFTYGSGGQAQTGQVVFVPEPATSVALLLGLGGLLRHRRVN
ncbi:MAG: PEP-CTERM sorting domain-containing protein [Planctomycetota bacterium]